MSLLDEIFGTGGYTSPGYSENGFDPVSFASSILGGGGSGSYIGPALTAGSSVIGTLGGLYQNSQNQGQVSKQWDSQFAYQQQRDKVGDAFNQAKLAAELQAAGISAGATVKAAGIAAAAQNKRTLADLYGNVGNQLGGQAQNIGREYNLLGSALADPYIMRGRVDR